MPKRKQYYETKANDESNRDDNIDYCWGRRWKRQYSFGHCNYCWSTMPLLLLHGKQVNIFSSYVSFSGSLHETPKGEQLTAVSPKLTLLQRSVDERGNHMAFPSLALPTKFCVIIFMFISRFSSCAAAGDENKRKIKTTVNVWYLQRARLSIW
mmetsp:Transcript_16183/g.26715  ORF Transcript_16183/g.26715 Transcript_16183/m.26715 type:complete len:153 (+) Transcript_16183:333-791(+)